MATHMQSGSVRSPSAVDADSVKGMQRTTSDPQIKVKKSLGTKIKDFFKKPFTKKASTATDIPLDQRTDISSSQNLDKKQGWNPYQQPAHGQIFVPGSIAVVKRGEETVAYVPGNIAVAINRPGLDMNNVPMILAQNQVEEADQVMEETPKVADEMSPKFEEIEPQYNPVDVAAQVHEFEHMNEIDAKRYGAMRESRMLYTSNTIQPYAQQGYPSSVKKPTYIKPNDREAVMRGSRTYA